MILNYDMKYVTWLFDLPFWFMQYVYKTVACMVSEKFTMSTTEDKSLFLGPMRIWYDTFIVQKWIIVLIVKQCNNGCVISIFKVMGSGRWQ